MSKRPKIIRGMVCDEHGNPQQTRAVNASDLKRGPRRREQLPEDLRDKAERLFQRVGRFLMTQDEWNEGFLHDMHPDRELAIWQSIADVCESSIGRRIKDKTRRIRAVTAVSAGLVDAGGHLGLTDDLIAEIREALGYVTPSGGRVSAESRTAVPEGMVHISQLAKAMEGDWQSRNDPLIDALRSVDVVVAVNQERTQVRVVYGKATLEAIARKDPAVVGQSPTAMQVVCVLSDDRDDLEVLCAICMVIKGSCDSE